MLNKVSVDNAPHRSGDGQFRDVNIDVGLLRIHLEKSLADCLCTCLSLDTYVGFNFIVFCEGESKGLTVL